MEKLNCIVADDERTARQGIVSYVQDVPYLTLVGECKSAIELDALLLDQQADLILLDINMPGITGLDWVKHAVNPPMVIFTTAHREYAIEGYELNVVDYLLKPISFPRFSQGVKKAYELAASKSATEPQNKDDRHIFIKEDNQTIKIYLRDVMYFEAAVDYIFIHTDHRRYMTLFSMKQVEREVDGLSFLRIHRSYIVNTEKVKLIEGRQVVVGDAKLPISRNLFQDVFDRLVSNRLWKE